MILAEGKAARLPYANMSTICHGICIIFYLVTRCQQHSSFSPSCTHRNCVNRGRHILDGVINSKCLSVIAVFLAVLTGFNICLHTIICLGLLPLKIRWNLCTCEWVCFYLHTEGIAAQQESVLSRTALMSCPI